MDWTWMNSLRSSPNGSIKKYGLIGKVIDNELSSVEGTHLGFALTCTQVVRFMKCEEPITLQGYNMRTMYLVFFLKERNIHK
jgi:hypothetical protein